jgi:hypothetical protein
MTNPFAPFALRVSPRRSSTPSACARRETPKKKKEPGASAGGDLWDLLPRGTVRTGSEALRGPPGPAGHGRLT